MLQAEQVLKDRYQLQDQLGHNAGRQTWLALDVTTSHPEPVIVKLLAFSPVVQWEELKLFEREAQVLKDLNHPQIPQYRDYFSLDKTTGNPLCWFALVQTYIPGQSLQQLLKEGRRFSDTQVRKIATDVLSILTYLHKLNPPVLHRDIKPSNLILGEDEQVYLVDFGAVQNQAATEGVTFTVVGTTGYAPLEQFWGKAVPASDLYALGATLIHLLTGTSPADLPQKNLRIQFRQQVSINPKFVGWIETLTEPDIERRFSTAGEAIEGLESGISPNSFLPSFPQPHNSRIQLQKRPSSLTIKIPRAKLTLLKLLGLATNAFLTLSSLPLLLLTGFTGIIMAALVVFYLVDLATNTNLPKLYILLLPLLLGLIGWTWTGIAKEVDRLGYSLNKALTSYLISNKLHFDEETFVIKKYFMGIEYIRQGGTTLDISKVNVALQGILITTDLNQYNFGQKLSDNERNWLIQEMQDWLDCRNES